MKPSPYAGFDPLDEARNWEDRTREVVFHRLQHAPEIRFFTEREVATLDAIVDRILPQEDREPEARVPITPFIDQVLFEDDTDGFRKADMPWEQDAWKWGLAGIDETSRARFGADFGALDAERQNEVLSAVQKGQAEGEVWQRLPAGKFFGKLVQQVISMYYAHPAAWAEIGWPGPASKRGYMRTAYGRIDPWQPRPAHELPSVALVQANEDGSGAGGSGGALH
ncbi:gluconate 2-dehydrogenase subunit 3 family protein [Blastococcus capsensis]|uniref:gluconate 2-dehydrogenase subunit 3 family protein n=1 Tax=Blastococcus capsensis TaxID=1564163 RepID=UPI0025418E68|nr:gluconate 2-dehydrogenase subunit 3 family protein [Blastococcus capsensis]MDK3258728.1 gluconate 2-dehydrogenase subunit 3 family protein [Blastococcus capsensis]